MKISAKPHNILLFAAALSALAFYIVFILRTGFVQNGETVYTLIDDAMISMRYAKNFADGHGFVWNVGGEVVQGYTNLLWTVYFGFLHDIFHSASTVSLMVMLTGCLILILNGIYIGKITFYYSRDNVASYCALLFTLFFYPLVFWTLRGMETGLVALLASMAVYYALTGRFYIVSILIFTLPFVRMDAVLISGIVGFYCLFRGFFMPLISCLLGLGCVLLIQKGYYGSYLPNTFVLKMVGVSQAEKSAVGFKMFMSNAFMSVIVPFSIAILYFRRNMDYLFLLALFLIQIAYSIYVGGDYAEHNTHMVNRFVAVTLPFIAVLVLSIFSRKMLILMLIILVAPFVSNYTRWEKNNAPLLESDIRRARVGMLIDGYTEKDAIIAVHGAGNIGYYSNRTAMDILGKSDSYIANQRPKAPFRPGHNKWDYEYAVIRMRADLVADEWGDCAFYLKSHPEYQRLKNGIRIDRASEKIIDVKALGGER